MIEQLRKTLIDMGFNFELVMKMTDAELLHINNISNSHELEEYMIFMAIKYDI